MKTLERRIALLEQSSIPPDKANVSLVFVCDGESEAEALRREGFENDKRVIVIRFIKPSHDKH